MPKLGSQLLDFIQSGLAERKYSNLQHYELPGVDAFSLEHMHKRNRKWPEEYSRIYEDYHRLKRPGSPLPGWTKLKGMLDSALNRKGSKYIRLLGREGKKYVYEINYFASSGSEPSSPTPSLSTSGDEVFGSDLKPGISLSNTILDMDLTLSPEMYEVEYTNSTTDYVDSATPSPETAELESINLADIENFDGNEVLILNNNDEMGLFSDDPTCFLKNKSSGSDVQQNFISALGSMEFLKMENHIIELIPNGDGVLNPGIAPALPVGCSVKNENFSTLDASTDNKLVYGSQSTETNGNDMLGAANLQNVLASTAVQCPPADVQCPPAVVQCPPADVQCPPADVQCPPADVQCVPEFALLPGNLSQHTYCERSLEIAKTGEDQYTYIFKTITNSLPTNDPVFLYLSKMCSSA